MMGGSQSFPGQWWSPHIQPQCQEKVSVLGENLTCTCRMQAFATGGGSSLKNVPQINKLDFLDWGIVTSQTWLAGTDRNLADACPLLTTDRLIWLGKQFVCLPKSLVLELWSSGSSVIGLRIQLTRLLSDMALESGCWGGPFHNKITVTGDVQQRAPHVSLPWLTRDPPSTCSLPSITSTGYQTNCITRSLTAGLQHTKPKQTFLTRPLPGISIIATKPD